MSAGVLLGLLLDDSEDRAPGMKRLWPDQDGDDLGETLAERERTARYAGVAPV